MRVRLDVEGEVIRIERWEWSADPYRRIGQLKVLL